MSKDLEHHRLTVTVTHVYCWKSLLNTKHLPAPRCRLLSTHLHLSTFSSSETLWWSINSVGFQRGWGANAQLVESDDEPRPPVCRPDRTSMELLGGVERSDEKFCSSGGTIGWFWFWSSEAPPLCPLRLKLGFCTSSAAKASDPVLRVKFSPVAPSVPAGGVWRGGLLVFGGICYQLSNYQICRPPPKHISINQLCCQSPAERRVVGGDELTGRPPGEDDNQRSPDSCLVLGPSCWSSETQTLSEEHVKKHQRMHLSGKYSKLWLQR